MRNPFRRPTTPPDQTDELVKALLVEHTRNVELEKRVASLQTHCDWLMQHVNELKMERATLFDKALNITFPAVPIIERAAPLPGADPAYRAGEARPDPDLGNILAQARELRAESRRPTEERQSMVAADLSALSFEDVGDEAAKALGIEHTPDGRVRYTR